MPLSIYVALALAISPACPPFNVPARSKRVRDVGCGASVVHGYFFNLIGYKIYFNSLNIIEKSRLFIRSWPLLILNSLSDKGPQKFLSDELEILFFKGII